MGEGADSLSWYVLHFCGGRGTRLWPLARLDRPKCLLTAPGHDHSLLQEAALRLERVVEHDHVRFVTNEVAAASVRHQLMEIDWEADMCASQVLSASPDVGTAAILVAKAEQMACQAPGTLLLVSYPDDLIPYAEPELNRYRAAVRAAFRYAHGNTGWDATYIGVKAERADPFYGYLQPSLLSREDHEGFCVRPARLVEKPTREQAEMYVDAGWFWNPTVVVQVDRFVALCRSLYPALGEALSRLVQQRPVPPLSEFVDQVSKVHRLAGESAEYAIFTDPSAHVCVLEADFTWQDAGTWEKLRQAGQRDACGNVRLMSEPGLAPGPEITECTVLAPDGKLVVARGLDGYLVVDTGDVLLICPRDPEHLRAVAQSAKGPSGPGAPFVGKAVGYDIPGTLKCATDGGDS